jgi:hypothetical protein
MSDDKLLVIDLKPMPSGARYEDAYGKYLDIFKRVAETPPEVKVRVLYAPCSWVPLLVYLGAEVDSVQDFFDHDCVLRSMMTDSDGDYDGIGAVDRTMVEVLCGFRPECVDALWKCDMEWDCKRTRDEGKREFIVTTNGAFYRKEVLRYLETLQVYRSPYRFAVLIPCAADKPYPALLHQRVLDILPPHYELITATGVLGLVPQSLWAVMPYYDSGIPNEWRLYNMTREYFNRHDYVHVISYTDFYSYAIAQGFAAIGQSERLQFVDPPVRRMGYLDLLAPHRLDALRLMFKPETAATETCHARFRNGMMRCVCGNAWERGAEKPECKHHKPASEVV